ncbi:MAG: tyrosine-type recombinase/integrase [Telluria sp.]
MQPLVSGSDRALAAASTPLADPAQRQMLLGLARMAVERRGNAAGLPFQLTDRAWASIDALLGQADAEATTRSYAAARRLFMAWWLLTYARPFVLPVPPEAIAQFIADFTPNDVRAPSADADWVDHQLVVAGIKAKPGPIRYSTLKQRVAAIASWHVDAEQASPFAQPLVKKVLRAARRMADDTGQLTPKRRSGVARPALLKLLDTCDNSDTGVRDRAMLLFAWGTGGRRPAEVAAADIRQLRALDQERYVYTMRRSKTQKPGAKPSELPLLGIVAEAMTAWLHRRDQLDAARHAQVVRDAMLAGMPGPERHDRPAIFRGMRGPHAGAGMTAKAVGEVVRRRCQLAGLSGNFGGHSLRRGFTTQAWNDRMNPADIMALTLHTNIASVMVYNEAAGVADNPAADLLGGGKR